MRLFAIGDIHGNLWELTGLIRQVLDDGMVPERDTVVFLGDVVDSGPDSRGVVDQLMAWQRDYPHWVFLMGNHDAMMVDALDHEDDPARMSLWLTQGGAETCLSYLSPPGDRSTNDRPVPRASALVPVAHREWLRGLTLFHETEQYIFVHAGLRPPLPPRDNSRHDLLWIREPFILSAHDWGKRVIFAHTPVREPLVLPNKIGIDTLPRTTGKLCAVELDPGDRFGEPRFFFEVATAGGEW